MTVTTPSAPALGGAHTAHKSILITVHEVLLGTAAALGSRRSSRRPKPRRDYPKRYEYLERPAWDGRWTGYEAVGRRIAGVRRGDWVGVFHGGIEGLGGLG
jgi:hypothetical protein